MCQVLLAFEYHIFNVLPNILWAAIRPVGFSRSQLWPNFELLVISICWDILGVCLGANRPFSVLCGLRDVVCFLRF